jgi:hypothetical protein
MQRMWSADELGECWSLLPEDLTLLAGRVDAGKRNPGRMVFCRENSSN